MPGSTLGNAVLDDQCGNAHILNGCGSIFCHDSMLQIFKGDCVFVPVGTTDIRLHARTEFLRISC